MPISVLVEEGILEVPWRLKTFREEGLQILVSNALQEIKATEGLTLFSLNLRSQWSH